MLVSRLVPLMVMGGIGLHSGGAIKDRLQGALGTRDRIVTKQRIVTVLEAATLEAASEDGLAFRNQGEFRRFVRKAVRIRGSDREDASLDFWGTPLKGEIQGRRMTVTSAGADRKFGSKDDIQESRNIFNY